MILLILASFFIVASAEEPIYSKWQSDIENVEFIRISNETWKEFRNKSEFATYKFITQSSDQTVLFDQSRNFYIRIDSTFAESGNDLNEIYDYLFTGQWIMRDRSVWSADGEDKQFIQKTDAIWIERQKGRSYNQFLYVSTKDDKVVLYAEDRNFYISLDSHSALWGYSTDAIYYEFNKGSWIYLEDELWV